MRASPLAAMWPTGAVLLSATLVAMSGCASVPQKGGFEDVQAQVHRRTNQRVEWHQSKVEDDAVATALDKMLGEDLLVGQAVQIALLNNRRLQATFEDLGLAQAHLVQAGLLRNPLFSGGVFFPDQGGENRIDVSLVQSFLSILYRPLRKRVAAAEFEAAKLSVTRAVLGLSAETRSTYYLVQGDMQRKELLRQVVDATGAAHEFSQKLHQAGNVTKLDVARERALYEEARLALSAAETDLVIDSERLNRLMGLWGEQTGWKISARLPELPSEVQALEDLERRVVDSNLDLAIYRHRIEAIATVLGLTEKTALVPVLEFGVGAEREDGDWEAGPTIELEVPIFDQGQARRAAALSDLRRAQQAYWALAVELRSAARALNQRLTTARRRAAHVADVVLPLSNQIVGDTLLQYNAMQLGVFELLVAKRNQITAGLQFIETRRDYWLVRTELDQLLSGHLGEVLAAPKWAVPGMGGSHMGREGG